MTATMSSNGNDIIPSSSIDTKNFVPLESTKSAIASQLSIFETNEWFKDMIQAFVVSLSFIVISEIGDKTFFITAIMAVKNSRLLVFLSSSFALFTMTLLSVVMGVAVTVVPKLFTQLVSVILFLLFGLKMLKEAHAMNEEGLTENAEYTEAKKQIEQRDEVEKKNKIADLTSHNNNLGIINLAMIDENNNQSDTQAPFGQISSTEKAVSKEKNDQYSVVKTYVSSFKSAPLFFNIFTMIFLAEWGDRSQVSTIILAAKENATGVFFGSFFGHVICNAMAVIGGRFVAEIVSVKTMNYIGGVVFLIFGLYALWESIIEFQG